jgi:hypothetical protein
MEAYKEAYEGLLVSACTLHQSTNNALLLA